MNGTDTDELKNPWSVDDASYFLKYCCPECDYIHKDLTVFSEHALDNHIESLTLFKEQKIDL